MTTTPMDRPLVVEAGAFLGKRGNMEMGVAYDNRFPFPSASSAALIAACKILGRTPYWLGKVIDCKSPIYSWLDTPNGAKARSSPSTFYMTRILMVVCLRKMNPQVWTYEALEHIDWETFSIESGKDPVPAARPALRPEPGPSQRPLFEERS